jgi:hypothetical protein
MSGTEIVGGVTDTPSPELYVKLALSYVPHLVQLVDKNPYSPTYGCFDREYWHYRTLDFPCGMSQEMCLPFALLFAREYPGNKYFEWDRIRELAIAGINFAIKGSHADGSCDDYFPYEQAMGALVFSTYACTETYQVLGLQDDRMVDFFRKRGDHLEKHNETGRLSNHQAFAALAAYNIYLITGDEKYKRVAEDRVELTLSWQHKEEGWFQEYEGADPGYHTCTIDFLAKLFKKSGDESLKKPLIKAVEFAWHFMHPDGSYGGEYGSRNTYHFYPHGFEIMAPFTEKAAQINDCFLQGLATDKRYHNDDDRMCCHTVYDWLQAYDDYHPGRTESINTRDNFIKWMPGCGIAVVKTDRYYGVSNLNKGGVTKVYSEDHCIGSDTGLVGELDTGQVIVTHLMDDEHVVHADPENGTFTVEGVFSYRRSKLSSPKKIIVFRIINMTVGRFFPNLLRLLVQKLLITGKPRTTYRFKRTVRFEEERVAIADEIPQAIPLKRLSAASDATSIYVANSNVYHESTVRVPWQHADETMVSKVRTGAATWKR